MVVGEVLVCGLIKGNIPGCCCCFFLSLSHSLSLSLFVFSLTHAVMRNGSREAGGNSTAQFIIHVIHTKASCSKQTQKISISPLSLFFLSRFKLLFFINPHFVTSSLLMVLSSYHLTGKLIPVFDYSQPQHNDPYPSPLVLLKLPFSWIGCQGKVIILFLNFWLGFCLGLSCNTFTCTVI